jgi:hypothetical protein
MKMLIPVCRWCGAELNSPRDFCDWFCKNEWEEGKADYDRDLEQSRLFVEGYYED